MSSSDGKKKTTSGEGDRPTVCLHWFRKALRLHDNPALLASLRTVNGNDNNKGNKLYPVYVLDGDSYQLHKCSALRANFLVECLTDLNESLQSKGTTLFCPKGDPIEVLPHLFDKWNVTHLVFDLEENGEPYGVARDEAICQLAKEAGVEVTAVSTETLHPLKEGYVKKVGGNAKNVPGTMGSFTTLLQRMGPIPRPVAAPSEEEFRRSSPVQSEGKGGKGEQKEEEEGSMGMDPPRHPCDLPWPRSTPRSKVTPLWNRSDCANLTPLVHGGESLALQRLHTMVSKRPTYVASFEKPQTSCTATSDPSTTVLSPYLSIGCLSPRTAWYAISDAIARAPASCKKSKPPVSLHGQLMWRDFNNLIAHSANVHNPGSWGQMERNVYCRNVPWSNDPDLLQKWTEGRTGYPWIDACMTQLRTEGWIHHLGRHAVACFLTRGDLWQSWIPGAAHFEGQLLDADYALNNFNWMWLSCSGFFYQYFRCYSPVAFQQKNDKSGAYIRKWIPALRNLPDKYIYEPWKAPIAVQKEAGFKIGVDYPRPIVDHKVVSKENMSKMSLAYDLYKQKVADEKKNAKGKSGGASSSSSSSGAGGPAKKKQKRQSKLK